MYFSWAQCLITSINIQMSVIIKNEMFIKIQLFSFHFLLTTLTSSSFLSLSLSLSIHLLHLRGRYFSISCSFPPFDHQPKLLLLLNKLLHIIFRCRFCCRCSSTNNAKNIRRIFFQDVNYTFSFLPHFLMQFTQVKRKIIKICGLFFSK